MQIHVLITLTVRCMLHKPRTTAFDLYTASSLLLNVLDIIATMANNLSTKIETWDWLKIDRNPLFGPFAPAELVSFDLLWLSSTETSFIN
jgi:hypothetical protein